MSVTLSAVLMFSLLGLLSMVYSKLGTAA